MTLYAVLLFAVPSRLVFKPLGGVGTPAAMVGMVAFIWWVWDTTHRSGPRRPLVPVERAGLILLAVALGSFVAATSRVINTTEMHGVQQGCLGMIALVGVMLTSSAGVTSSERLHVLLRRITLFAGLVGALGFIQFVTKHTFIDNLSIPGLTWNSDVEVADRNGFYRPAGTATHPLEFATTTAVLLPLALHVALDSKWETSSLRRWFPVAMLCLAVPLSISRSAIIGTAIIVVVLFPTWHRTLRKAALVVGSLLLVAVYVSIPGFLGTIQGMFTGLQNNASIGSRTDSYTLASEFIARAPIFGRGVGTFNASYRILDNQYLATLIDMGLVGLICLLGVFVTGLVTAARVRMLATDERDRSLAITLVASIAASTTSYGFFDAFSFPMFSGVSFLLVGLAGQLGREQIARQRGRTDGPASSETWAN
ncbi:O-antigen ligase [Phycicoccus badiiscoriae]|uniref:O-antigen ligase n=1 Tax=Pedococcus badiiscoriae TaxID=642776 RepID=A0A852WQ64_9MICO|nr:O-antigen ligase family protein [Pedococcus badiiscoriae]NYG07382.1 O-antigen ligase [Pedococcus badiiscoriae]